MFESAKVLASGPATISLAGTGVGIGVVSAGLMHAVARNPFMVKQPFTYAIPGFASTEAIALFGPMMAFLSLFALRITRRASLTGVDIVVLRT